jgi:hypothetical protein
MSTVRGVSAGHCIYQGKRAPKLMVCNVVFDDGSRSHGPTWEEVGLASLPDFVRIL